MGADKWKGKERRIGEGKKQERGMYVNIFNTVKLSLVVVALTYLH